MAMVAEAPGAIFTVIGIAITSLLFGFVLLYLIRIWLVDQTLHGHEALFVVIGLFILLGTTVSLWGSLWMVLPPLAGAGAVLAFHGTLTARQKQAKADYYAREESRARRIIDRDPTAIVGYERLGELLLEQRRLPEALAVMRQLLARTPNDKHLVRRIAGLEAELALAPTVTAPEAPAIDPMLERRQAAPQPAPQPRTPAVAAAIDFTTVEPEPEPAPEPEPVEPAVAPAEDDSVLAFAPDAVDDARVLDFAPGSRAFDEQALAFDPDADEAEADDGFHTRREDVAGS